MEISFQRFAQLTAVIAAGGSIAVACTVNSVENNQIAPQGGTNTGVAGSGGNAAQTNAGTNSISGGTSNTAGALVSAGSPGVAGTPAAAGNTGELLTAGTTGNEAGSPGVAGSSAATTSAGQSSIAGAAGSAGEPTTTGTAGAGGTAAAGAPGVAGTPGVAGSTSTSCVTSDPAAEGMGYDCTTLPYYGEECPDPTGEGYPISTVGVTVCEWYASSRTASVQILTDCLKGLTKPAGGWCGAEHEAQVAACVAQMAQKTCVSAAAQTACATYKTQCPGLTLAACVGTLSALSDDEVMYIEPCMESIGLLPDACDAMLNRCTVHVDHAVSVVTACASLKSSCTAVDLNSCETALDYNSTGVTPELNAKVDLPLCMAFGQQFSGYTCGEAFSNCI